MIQYLDREWGMHYALGGTSAIVESLGKLFEELGCKVTLNGEVAEITTNRRKPDQDGEIRKTDLR